ncbi:MAG: hypothetical protein M3441_16650 [Chloroflexota bacterium]|nr:hypothetical protein [Chloroflexota bacterium]
MAIAHEMGGQAYDTPSAHDTSNEAHMLASTLRAYRNRLGRDRGRAFVGAAGVGIGVMWIAMSLLYAVDMVAPVLLALAVGLTLTLPFLALLAEIITRPSLRSTARILDSRLDDRQRLVTALELAGKPELGLLDATQVTTSARFLSRVDPKAVTPIRSMRPSLALTAGLLCLSLAVFVLKGTGGQYVPYQAGVLPQTPEELAQLATPTAVTGLPEAERQATQQASSPNPTPGGNGQTQAQEEAAESQEAKSSLDTLGESLDGQGATQSIADSLRNGNYDEAAKQLEELGRQNDQLSEEAKRNLAQALDNASDDPNTTDDLRWKERQAADALRNGNYEDIEDALADLGRGVQDTAGKVMTQEEMARAFPSPTAAAAGSQQAPPSSPSEGQNGQQSGEQSGQQGQEGQEGQEGTESGEQGEGGQEGQEGQEGEGQQGEAQEGEQSGNQQGQGQPGDQEGAGQAGAGEGQEGSEGQPGSGQQGGGQTQNQQQGGGSPGAGDGHRESGPTGPGGVNGGVSNPFELEGNKDPQGGNPSDGNQPALSVEGDGRQSDTAAPADEGTASNVPGENSRVPVERWDVVQRYFNGR